MEAYTVSVIVTTRNEEKSIENCLKSIKGQARQRDNIEIIVVDNNSKDKTKEIAGRYTNKIYNLGPERSSQRNFGVKQASAKYILYLDADMALSENVIKECVEKCEIEGYIALYIPERIIGRGYWIRARNFERGFYDATCIDCVRFVRRDKFLQINGFDEELTGPEDWDFDRRIKAIGRVDIISSPLYHNEREFRLSRYLEKKSYYSKSFDRYIEKWGKDDPIVNKQLGFWYRYFGVFCEQGKWKKVLMHPGLDLGMYILRILVGIRYITYGR
jgi:glycosyltransferase involved in cell wall biosynthesis